MPNYTVKAMLLQKRRVLAEVYFKLYCCNTTIYQTFKILAYLRAKVTFVISIARKWQLKTLAWNLQ